jgi:putative DNA primase/helicase
MVRRNIDFPAIAQAALYQAVPLLQSWLPEGRHNGVEYKAKNPKRVDRKLGSFSINTQTGRWADFATGDAGGDLISLYAYLHACSQIAAARELAFILGVRHD